MMGNFRSLYRPSYQLHGLSWAGLRHKYKNAFLLAILVHVFVFIFVSVLYKPFDFSLKKEEDFLIEVSPSMVIPDGLPEAEVKKNPPPNPAPADQVSEQPTTEFKNKTKTPSSKSTHAPVEKFEKHEDALRLPAFEPVKEQSEPLKKLAEPVKEEPVKVEPVIKEVEAKEEKKVIALEKQEKPHEKSQDKPAEPVKVLPVLVDKMNKEKDAPELPPASFARSSNATFSSSEQATSGSAATQAGSGSRSDAASAVASSAAMTSIQSTSGAPVAAALTSTQGIPGGANTEAQYINKDLNNKMPPYPVMAKRMRQEGTVVLVVEVLENGTAGDIRIAVTSNSELLDKVALETVKKWNFQPAKKEGTPYVQRLRIPITFKL
jgi:TonB family protein